jgi:hypothetical protein
MPQPPYRLSAPLAAGDFAAVRRRAIFECCKWDPQVEDVAALSSCALSLDAIEWRRIAAWSETLAEETLRAERELLSRPRLHKMLGLPRAVRRALAAASQSGPPAEAARVMRFDFHFTTEGWRISEVNSDVPGGFIEASGVTQLMAGHFLGQSPTGDPAEAYAGAVFRAAGAGGLVALVHATAYTDDRQVMIFLARRLEQLGLRTCLIGPDQLRWQSGRAHIATAWQNGPADVLLRFFPAEWLPNLPRRCGWPHFFAGARTPLSNPATALLTQSKRFPLAWDQLEEPLQTWRALLPDTRDPRAASWRGGDWMLKPALGRVGDGIGAPGFSEAKEWRKIARDARWHPRDWAAQRRFEIVPVESAAGPLYPCLGVYTIDGAAAGIYGRLAARPIVDHRAQDVAVLLEAAPPVATFAEAAAYAL